MKISIERAINLVELETEELEEQVPSLQPSPQPESPAPIKTPQNVQSTGGGEKLLEDDNKKIRRYEGDKTRGIQ